MRSLHAKRVLDLGCGEGKLLRHLLAEPQFEAIVGMDVSWRSLELASERLKLDRLAGQARTRLQLLQGSLVYRDQRLSGFDAAAVVEVIEHLDAARIASFERVLFEFARPTHVVLTTPNAEYNAVFDTLRPANSVTAITVSYGRALSSSAGPTRSLRVSNTPFASSRSVDVFGE